MTSIGTSVWAYPLIVATITGSALFPPLPSETTLVTATSLASSGRLNPIFVATATTLGAILGDLSAYTVGRWGSTRIRRRADHSQRTRNTLGWLEAHQAGWGPALIVAGRFVPGGTTTVGLAAGALAFPLRRLLLFSLLGALLWTGYGFAIANLGHAVFPDNTWASVLLAIGLVLGIGALTHVASRRRRRHPPHRSPDIDEM